MSPHEDHLRKMLNSLEDYGPDRQIDVVRGVTVPLLEHLGYSLARDAAASAASAAFILAADLEKRLTRIEAMITQDGL